MSVHDLKKDEKNSSSSKTYIEFQSDASEPQRKAYRLASRGGRIRQGVEDIDNLYALLTPKLAEVLFENNPIPMMKWLDLDEDDWETYEEEHLND